MDLQPTWVWIQRILPIHVVHLLTSLVVALAVQIRSYWLLIPAAMLLVAVTSVVEARMSAQRSAQGLLAVRLRLALGVVQLGVGVVLVWVADDESLMFVGVMSLFLFVTSLRVELRHSHLGTHVRGKLALGAAVLTQVAGLGPVGQASPRAGILLFGFGVVLAGAGIELSTEDWTRRPTVPSRSTTLRLAAAILVFAAAFVLARDPEPGSFALVLFLGVVTGVVVLAVSSDGDAGELMAVFLLAVIWAATPRDVSPTESVRPTSGEPFAVALGDSYISGEGADRFFAGTNDRLVNECRRAPSAYPVLLADETREATPDRVLFLACSGAVTVDLYGARPGRTESTSQLDQLERTMLDLDLSRDDLELVLLSIGGNDAGFGEIAGACLGPGDCSEIGSRWLARLDRVDEALDLAYGEVADALEGTDARVLVVPYPMPLAEHGCWWSPLAHREANFLAGFVRELNTVVATVADRHHFEVVETMEPTFEPDRLRVCDRNWPSGLGMNFIGLHPTSGDLGDVINPRNWLHNSLHPNEVGHRAMADTVETWLAEPQPGVMDRLEEAPQPIALPCPIGEGDDEDLPEPCRQTTAEWQVTQVIDMLRRDLFPMALMAAGFWLLVAPWIRSRVWRNAGGPGRRMLEKMESPVDRLLNREDRDLPGVSRR